MKIEAKQRLVADVHQGIIPRLMGWIQEVLHAKFEDAGNGTYHMHTKANAEQAIRRYMSIEDLMGRSGAKAEAPKLEPHGVTFEFDLDEGKDNPQMAGQGQTKMAVTFTQEGLYVALRVSSQGIPTEQPAQEGQEQQQGQQPQQQQQPQPQQNGQPQGQINRGQPQPAQQQGQKPQQQEKRMIQEQQRNTKRYEQPGQ